MMNSDEYHFHSRVKVDGRSVDEKMAVLMKTVWDYGIRTVECCQGGPESPFYWSWVQFWNVADGLKFLEATAYLTNYTHADNLHMYLTPAILPQAGPSPMVLFKPELLEQISQLWAEGTAKKPEEKKKQ
jgi:hypothetical protein